MRRLRLLTDLSTMRQSMAFQSVVIVRPLAPFARPAARTQLSPRLASLTSPLGRLTRIASAPFQVGRKPYPAGYGFPSPFSRAGIRFSILPSPAGDLGLDLAVGLLPECVRQTLSGFTRSA